MKGFINPVNETILAIIVDVIKTFTAQNGYPPTTRELCSLTGVKSTGNMNSKLIKLKARGEITWTEGKTRTLKVVIRCQ